MSATEKYGRSIESLSPDALRQTHAVGRSLANNGVSHQASLGNMVPAHTPAMKYGAPGGTNALSRSLSQDRQQRSL